MDKDQKMTENTTLQTNSDIPRTYYVRRYVSKKIADGLMEDKCKYANIVNAVYAEVEDNYPFPIGNTENIALIPPLDCYMLAYLYKEPVQDIVDRYSQEADAAQDPSVYIERMLRSMLEARTEYTDDYENTAKKAMDYVESHNNISRPRPSKLSVVICYKDNDTDYMLLSEAGSQEVQRKKI